MNSTLKDFENDNSEDENFKKVAKEKLNVIQEKDETKDKNDEKPEDMLIKMTNLMSLLQQWKKR